MNQKWMKNGWIKKISSVWPIFVEKHIWVPKSTHILKTAAHKWIVNHILCSLTVGFQLHKTKMIVKITHYLSCSCLSVIEKYPRINGDWLESEPRSCFFIALWWVSNFKPFLHFAEWKDDVPQHKPRPQEDGAPPSGVCRLPFGFAIFPGKSQVARKAIGPNFGRYQRHHQRCAGKSPFSQKRPLWHPTRG